MLSNFSFKSSKNTPKSHVKEELKGHVNEFQNLWKQSTKFKTSIHLDANDRQKLTDTLGNATQQIEDAKNKMHSEAHSSDACREAVDSVAEHVTAVREEIERADSKIKRVQAQTDRLISKRQDMLKKAATIKAAARQPSRDYLKLSQSAVDSVESSLGSSSGTTSLENIEKEMDLAITFLDLTQRFQVASAALGKIQNDASGVKDLAQFHTATHWESTLSEVLGMELNSQTRDQKFVDKVMEQVTEFENELQACDSEFVPAKHHSNPTKMPAQTPDHSTFTNMPAQTPDHSTFTQMPAHSPDHSTFTKMPVKMPKKELQLFKESPDFVTVAIFSGTQLPVMDQIGSCDPYVKIVMGGKSIHDTKFKMNTLEPIWDQLFSINVSQALQSCEGIELQIFDHNFFHNDDCIGKVELKWEQMNGLEADFPIASVETVPDEGPAGNKGSIKVQVAKYQIVSRDFRQGLIMPKKYSDELKMMHNISLDNAAVKIQCLHRQVSSKKIVQQKREEKYLHMLETQRSLREGMVLFDESEDYVSIALFSATGLPKMDFIGSCDPFVIVRVAEKSSQTDVKPNTLEPTWNQLFCFRIDSRTNRSRAKISFEVYDDNKFKKPDYIGKFDVKLDEINGHQLELPVLGGKDPLHLDGTRRGTVRLQIVKAQATATDFKEGLKMGRHYFKELQIISEGIQQDAATKIQAFGRKRKAQKVVQGKREAAQKQLAEEQRLAEERRLREEEHKAAEQEWMKDPATFKLFKETNDCLSIAIFSGEGLPVVDMIGSCDAYIKAKIDRHEFQTEVKKDTLTPEWNQLFCYEVYPSFFDRDTLAFEVYDHNKFTKHEKIGQIEVQLHQMNGQELELPILTATQEQKGTIKLQVTKAEVIGKDFRQGMVMRPHYIKELDMINEAVHQNATIKIQALARQRTARQRLERKRQGKPFEGDQVYADFMGMGYRSGVVVKVNRDDTYDIVYEHRAKEIRVSGKKVQLDTEGFGAFIEEDTRPTTSGLLDVEKDDDEIEIADDIFRSYGGMTRFFGQIETIRCIGNCKKILEILRRPGMGRVLVIDGSGVKRFSLVDSDIASLALKKNWQGIVLNGCARHSEQLEMMAVGIKAIGTHPRKCRKDDVGEKGIPVYFASVKFVPGQWLYADRDGILVTPNKIHRRLKK